MRFLKSSLVLFLAAGLAGPLPLFGRQPAPVQAAAPLRDWSPFIGPFPKEGSEEAKGEAAIMLWLQRHRSTEDIRRAQSEVDLRPGLFSEILGRDLAKAPLTSRLLETATDFLRDNARPLKAHYHRPRPYDTDPRIQPCVKKEHSLSYPSGHASSGAFWSVILAEAAPARRQLILDRGLQIGTDRNLAGVHWPSDVEAGQKLGRALAELWLQDPAHRPLLEEARRELSLP